MADGVSYRRAARLKTTFARHRLIGALAIGLGAPAGAQDVAIPSFVLPPSSLLSDAARRVVTRQQTIHPPQFVDIAAARSFWGRYNDDRLAEMRAIFRTRVSRVTIGGVSVQIVEPASGIAPGNRHRILINVHGGAFLWGAGSGALVEAIPIAATMGIAVATVDYRLAPEHRYPAASQDVTAVYRELLHRYSPAAIGIYGCSAGGIITAQTIGWLRAHKIPRPGAIGTFCGTGGAMVGDGAVIGDTLASGTPAHLGALPAILPNAYMTGVPASDPIAYPLSSDAALRAFPPTLQLAGSRDFSASTLTYQHRRLSALGVRSELYLFDGLGHAFFVWPEMPESREAYRTVARFFDTTLARTKLGRSARTTGYRSGS